jgi:hypothetical protein
MVAHLTLKLLIFVNSKQIWKKNQIKDNVVLAMIEPVLTEYRRKIGELSTKLSMYNAEQLADLLSGKGIAKAEEINVIEFGRKRVAELYEAKRDASAKNMQTVINSSDSDNCNILHPPKRV